VADQKKNEKKEDNLSAPSSFIANAHNEIYAFYTEKSGFLKKMSQQGRGRPPLPPSPFESATVWYHCYN